MTLFIAAMVAWKTGRLQSTIEFGWRVGLHRYLHVGGRVLQRAEQQEGACQQARTYGDHEGYVGF
jgi:hypothetical protein